MTLIYLKNNDLFEFKLILKPYKFKIISQDTSQNLNGFLKFELLLLSQDTTQNV